MNLKDYINKYVYAGILLSILILLVCTYTFIRPLILERVVGNYNKETLPMYMSWYEIYVDEPNQLIDFKGQSVSDWSITSWYKYTSDKNKILSEYEKILQIKGWKYIGSDAQTRKYCKNNLLLFLTENDNNVWEVKVGIKGYNDRSILNKFIFGVAE